MPISLGIGFGVSHGGGGAAASPVSMTLSSTSRPAGTSYFKPMKRYHCIATHGAINDSTYTSSFASSAGVFKNTSATDQIIAVGDSLTGGNTSGVETWLSKTVRLAQTQKSKVVNFKNAAVDGQGFSYAYAQRFNNTNTLTQLGASMVDPAIDGTLNNWLVIWAGSNDIWLNAKTGAQTYALLQTYLDARVTAGWTESKIVVVTMLKRDNNSKEADRAAYNTAIVGKAKSGGGTYSYLVADVAMTLTDNTDTTYFDADLTHLKDAGQAVVAGIIRGVIFP